MTVKNYVGIDLATSVAPKTLVTAVGAEGLTGSLAADKLIGSGTGNLLVGGAGDDTYMVTSANDRVVESVGGGIDTVQVAQLRYYALAANVENLVAYGAMTALGNSLDNVISGKGYGQTLDGGAGNDVLSGGGAGDTFVFHTGSGNDVITDFSASGGDLIRLDYANINSFAKVQAALTQSGADAVLHLTSGDAIKLLNVNVADLKASDFQFTIDTSKLKLTFEDNFNTFSVHNSSTGLGTWNVDNRGPPNHEAAYVDPTSAAAKQLGANPYSVSDGVLTITGSEASAAEKAAFGADYTSGMITTENTFYQQYGYFEMRAELPQGQGAWPAFWLLPQGPHSIMDGELDVMEQVAKGFSHQAAHYGLDGRRMADGFDTQMGDITGYHTYGMLWTSQEIAWYIDGVEVNSIPTPAILNKPMYLLANLALGGDWAGSPEDHMADQQMNIDYIRAYGVDAAATASTINDAVAKSSGGSSTALISHVTLREGTVNGDRILGSSGDDHIKSGDGDDLLRGGAGDDILDGGAGSDTADYADAVRSVTVNLSLTGAQVTGAGQDTLISIENINGGDFNDVLTGDTGANTLSGGNGDDLLKGGAGDDTLVGGRGDDTLMGGAGNDVLDGGLGKDTADYSTASSDLTVSLAVTGGQNTRGAGIDTLIGIENLIGSAHNDTLTGDSTSNLIIGGAGADRIDGGAGVDTIIGGAGADILTGGAGADLFVFQAASDSTSAAMDVITDFKAIDLIDVSAIDANINLAGDQAFHYLGAAAFDGLAGGLRLQVGSDGTHILGDVNGDGIADFNLLLTGKIPALVAADFVL